MSVGEVTAGAVVLSLAVCAIAALAWRGSTEDRERPRKSRDAGASRRIVDLPIILVAEGSVELYDAVEAAECSCEAIDVWDGLIVAYDASGRPLAVHVDERDLVWMELDADGGIDPAAVSEHVREHIAACRPGADDLDGLSLPELLEKARTLGLIEQG